jgi:hypothetical protein
MSHEALPGHTCNLPSFSVNVNDMTVRYYSTLLCTRTTLIYILVVGQFGLATGSGGMTQSNVHTTSRVHQINDVHAPLPKSWSRCEILSLIRTGGKAIFECGQAYPQRAGRLMLQVSNLALPYRTGCM